MVQWPFCRFIPKSGEKSEPFLKSRKKAGLKMNHSSEAEKYCDQKMGADFKPALFVKKQI